MIESLRNKFKGKSAPQVIIDSKVDEAAAVDEYGISEREYAIYKLDEKEEQLKKEIFTQKDSERICDIHNIDINAKAVFGSRAALYTHHEEYIKRPWMETSKINPRKIKKVFGDEDKLVYRPLNTADKTNHVFDLAGGNINDICKEISSLPTGVVEGHIEQDNQMTQLSPEGIGSVKVMTIRTEKAMTGIEKNKLYFISACLCTPGSLAAVDVTSGEVLTGTDIKGTVIPSFDKIRSMIEVLAKEYNGYFCWNIALSVNGPAIIDVDAMPSAELVQLPYADAGKGKKYMMEKYMLDPDGKNAERPYGTKISNITKEGIEFYWKKPEVANGYEVFRGYEEDGPFYPIAFIKKRTVGTYIDADFDTDRREVYYSVRSYIDTDEGERIYSARTDVRKAVFRDTFVPERDATYMYSGTDRTIRAFYGWGEPADAVWSSDNEDVAVVSVDGTITAVGTGECNIICDSETVGSRAVSKVVVNRAACEPLSDIISRYSFDEKQGYWENKASSKTGDAVIMMVGDMMCGKRQMETQVTEEGGWNFNDSYKHIREVLTQADFSIGNLETLLAAGWPYMIDEVYIDNKNNCNATSRYLDAVKYAGFDAVAMSNNHNCDGGTRALVETIEQVDKYKFARTGAFKDAEEKRYMIIDVNGIKVGFLAYMSRFIGFNGKDADWSDDEKDVLLNVFSEERAKKDIADCRAAGAEFVIAYMHWGAKNFRKITKKQIIEAQEVADAGVDYIVGANPHLVQVYDEITAKDGRKIPCIYSMGNFQAIMNQVQGNRDSVIMRIRLKKSKNGHVELAENNYIPCYTYTECEGGHWTPVAMNKKLNPKVKKKNRKTLHDRIVNTVGTKIEEYQH